MSKTNEQIAEEAVVLLDWDAEFGIVPGEDEIASAVIEALEDAGRLIPDEWEYRCTNEMNTTPPSNAPCECSGTKERRRPAGPWVEVSGE